MTQAQRRVGLVLARASRVLGEEPYYHEFIEGLERVLTPAGVSVLVKVVTGRPAENDTYDRWAERGRVDGVILVDLAPDDERVTLVRRLNLPAVVLGDPSTASGMSTVWTDDAGYAREVVRFLAEGGHRVIGHISGPLIFAHSQLRRQGAQAEAAELGVTLAQADGDYSYESGRAAIAELLAGKPTAVFCDNDLMALAVLDALREREIAVPADMSVVAWDDSALCQLATPALSAMSHDVVRVGEIAANAMLDAITGKPPTVYQVPYAHIVVRDSTN
ncbi:ABC transporter substrate-binding protein [Actinoplanes sp. SE50]|uniref:LacI family DNA-binding transcriptional regulator n=1 Tax=unclassified Actinoplanes TaxID=2626549 RepID=UPI00023EC7EB|nr:MULTISPECIES: substrate-binding domain-containing protein [unclassified Actinoplanes]AEV84747.1 HTH-type transcriptional repressor purR [Actinoplanes sp. SE50/110]ATO83139.1 ABC transporter substrate-binding protein [Actinoplanes sp. SE50]SLM00546.1 ABC transporter substrate-binding protein [Actinoplanes sp. SE50/110]